MLDLRKRLIPITTRSILSILVVSIFLVSPARAQDDDGGNNGSGDEACCIFDFPNWHGESLSWIPVHPNLDLAVVSDDVNATVTAFLVCLDGTFIDAPIAFGARVLPEPDPCVSCSMCCEFLPLRTSSVPPPQAVNMSFGLISQPTPLPASGTTMTMPLLPGLQGYVLDLAAFAILPEVDDEVMVTFASAPRRIVLP